MFNSQLNCHHCGTEMAFIDYSRSRFCSEPACQRAQVQHIIQTQQEDAHAKLHAVAEGYFRNAQKEIAKPQSYQAVMLPANNCELNILSDERKSRFMHSLSRAYEDCQAKQPEASRTYAKQLTPSSSNQHSNLMGKACATCKGKCCLLGGEHAFLDYYSVKRILASLPHVTESSFFDLYASFLPEQSYENACVFHTQTGCALPEELRSNTCRNYECESLQAFEELVTKGPPNLYFAAAVKNGNLITVSKFDQNDFDYVIEEK